MRRARGASLQVPAQKDWEMVQAETLLSVYDRGWDLQLPEGYCFPLTICPWFYTSTHLMYKLWRFSYPLSYFEHNFH